MTQPTPPWGTPAVGTPVPATSASTSTSSVAETQVLPPVSAQVRPVGPTRADVELRSTALYYATKVVGDRGVASPDTHLATTLRVAKGLEAYLLTGNPA